MKSKLLLSLGLGFIFLSFSACNGGDDELSPKPENNYNCTFSPSGAVSQPDGYVVAGQDVVLCVTQEFGLVNQKLCFPSKYVLSVNGVDYVCNVNPKSEAGELVILQAPVKNLYVGYNSATLTYYYEYEGNQYSHSNSFKIGVVSKEPDFPLSWDESTKVCGGKTDTIVDADGVTHTTSVPSGFVNYFWDAISSTLSVDLPYESIFNPTTIYLNCSAEISSYEWVISNVAFIYNGQTTQGNLPINITPGVIHPDMQVNVKYNCKATIDGVNVDVNKTQTVTIKFMDNLINN